MSDPIRVQVEVKIDLPRGWAQPSRALVQEALDHWIATGELPSGFSISVLQWKRQGRSRRVTDEDDIEEARGLLQRVPFAFSEVRYR